MTLFPVARWRKLVWLLVLVLSIPASGCKRPNAAIDPPSIDPDGAAQAAMDQYDTNKDGVLDDQELTQCPGLAGLKTKGSNGVTRADIATRLTAYKNGKVGLRGNVPVRIYLNDAPLEGATVTLVPEAFMGSSFKPASGTTLATGHVVLKCADQEIPGCQWGFFKVQVSKKDASGNETIPARYNTSTTLGCEVLPKQTMNERDYTYRLTPD